MFTWIANVFAVLKALLELWKLWQGFQEQQRQEKEERLRKERERAAQDLSNAQSEDEFDQAQDDLVKGKG